MGIRRYQVEEGATLVEFAVVLPLFLMLALAVFDFGNIIYQHAVISQGHRIAGRAAAMQSTQCLSHAQTAFNDYVTGMLPWGVSAQISGQAMPLRIPGNGPLVLGYQLDIQAPVTCLFCSFLTGSTGSSQNYNRSSFYPFDDQGSSC